MRRWVLLKAQTTDSLGKYLHSETVFGRAGLALYSAHFFCETPKNDQQSCINLYWVTFLPFLHTMVTVNATLRNLLAISPSGTKRYGRHRPHAHSGLVLVRMYFTDIW